MESKDFRDEAARLKDQGIIPIALHAGTKKPLAESGWQLTPMPTAAQIKEIWSDGNAHNLGALMGERSDNAQGFDFDIYEAHSRWLREYKPPKTLMIFTPRGIRAIYKTDTPITGKMKGNVGDLLGNGRQSVMHPSELADGFPYTSNGMSIAHIPSDHPAVLALIREAERIVNAPQVEAGRRTNKKLARFAKAVLEGRYNLYGGRYHSRSEMEAALIESLYMSGFEADEISQMLDNSPNLERWHEIKRPEDRTKEIERIISKFGSTDSRQYRETMARADALRDYRISQVWKGSFVVPAPTDENGVIVGKASKASGASIEAVLLAHEMKARDAGDYQYQLDVRAGDGRFANMSRPTFQKAQRFILKNKLIQLINPFKGECANYFELHNVEVMKEKTHSLLPTSSQLCSPPPHNCDEVGKALCVFQSGVFEHRSLGRSAFIVYRHCQSAPMTAKDLQQSTGRHINTVRNALKNLLKCGLIEKDGTKYKSLTLTETQWQGVGEYLNSRQIVTDRQQQHAADRIARKESKKSPWIREPLKKEFKADAPANRVKPEPIVTAPEAPQSPPVRTASLHDRIPNKRSRREVVR